MTEPEILEQKPISKRQTVIKHIAEREMLMMCFGLLASMAMPYKGMAPFGVAFMAQERRFSIRSVLYLFIVALGCSVVCERADAIKYISAGLIYTGLLFVLERDVLLGNIAAGIGVGICIWCAGLFVLYFRGFSLDAFVLLCCEAAIATVSTWMMRKSILILKQGKGFPDKMNYDEKVSAGFVIALFVLSLKLFEISQLFSVMEMVAVVVILVVAASGGIAFSTAAGVLLGAVCGVGGNFFMPMIGALGFCGLVSGGFSKFGKVGVVVGLLLASSLLFVYNNGAMRTMVNFYEVMAASAVCILVPQKVLVRIENILKSDGKESEYASKIKEDLRIKLKSVSTSFGAMSGTLEKLSEKKESVMGDDIATVFDLATERICKNCRKSTVCWGKDFDFTYNSLLKMMRIMNEKGVVEMQDADERFKTKCLNTSKLITEINHQQDLYRVRCIWKTRMNESRELVSKQLLGVSTIIDNLSADISSDEHCAKITETELNKQFEKKGIKVRNISINRENSGRYVVGITVASCYWKDESRREIIKIMKKMFKCNVNMRDMTFDYGNFTRIEFTEAVRFKVETDCACRASSEENGDNYRFSYISEGKYVIALSDGMGTGSRAAKESEAMLELLDSFLRAGFDSKLAVQFINSVMLLKSEEDAFVTIDICIIDLYTGRAEFIKTGAEPSFIMYGNYTETVKAASLPVGIIADMEAEITNRTVGDGAVIVMMSDGIETREKGSLLWVGDFISEKSKKNQTDDLAEKILNKAIEENNGEVNDDMTVLSVKLREVC